MQKSSSQVQLFITPFYQSVAQGKTVIGRKRRIASIVLHVCNHQQYIERGSKALPQLPTQSRDPPTVLSTTSVAD